MSLAIRRLECGAPETANQLRQLRARLSTDGEVVSEAGRALTLEVFGAALTPRQSVERICAEVRAEGFPAVQRFSKAFDRFDLTPANFRVDEAELAQAHRLARPGLLDAVRRVRNNVLAFQTGILHQDATMRIGPGQVLQLRYRPMRRVGVCVPGGAAAYPSTLLMTIVPAQAAGVAEIAVVAPPTAFGSNNPDILAVCHELGVTEVYRLGGAHAVAALAYGVAGLPRVDLIVGPGNLFVALAKRCVYGAVGIDSIAGPSEVVVLADQSARPDFVAADLIAQAEHSPGASILITWHAPLLEAVADELERQLATLPRGDLARAALTEFGALVLARTPAEAIALTDEFAPEHLHIQTHLPESIADQISHAGAIFLGPFTPVALGDYAAGPSHVLPTSGTARFASGLSANDFQKRTSIIRCDEVGLQQLAPTVRWLADVEGLAGHAASVAVRDDAVSS